MKLRRLLLKEKSRYGLWVLARRGLTKTAGAAHGMALGWHGASVPWNSNVVGTKRIEVGFGFKARDGLWIEAISEYAGVSFSPKIRIGDNFRSSGSLHISAMESIEIGDDCLLGSNIYIADHSHGRYREGSQSRPDEAPSSRELGRVGPVLIGGSCWIGNNVVILGGVTIGAGTVIAANSVVLHDVPAGVIAMGAPARAVKHFDAESSSWTRLP
jgi:acetyltransferase-like isoleucine patch superfamily enzyme